MNKQIRYALVVLAAVVATFIIHEFTHWFTGQLLGYEMRMTLNHAYPVSGVYRENWHYTLVSATGPIITLVQSFIFFILIRKYHRQWLYPFLGAAFYLELLSGVMNFRNANDLGRISNSFGLGLFTIPAVFVTLHFYLLYRTTRRERYSVRQVARTFLLILLFSSIWILLNNKFEIVLL